MRTPTFLAKLRAHVRLSRRPDDPVDQVPLPHHEVRLTDIQNALDQSASWDDADTWCRTHVDHAAGHQWSKRIDRGPHHDRMTPVFTFSDANTALWFKLQFR